MSEVTEFTESTVNQESSEGERVTFAGEQMNFKEPRGGVIIEFGHGGGSILANKSTRDYLKDNNVNYLGVEKDHERAKALKDFLPMWPWADSTETDIFNAEVTPSPSVANEIWMRNFLASNATNAERVAKVAYTTLKDGGSIAFLDSYTKYNRSEAEEIKERYRQAGFEVRIFDPNNENHPIASKSSSDKSLFPSDTLAFFAVKPAA